MKFKSRKTLIVIAVVLILSGIVFYYFKIRYIPRSELLLYTEADTLAKEEVTKLYGIPVDSFDVEFDKVRRGQMLLSILYNYRLPEGALSELIANPPIEFDLRKIRAGNKYAIFLKKDSLGTVKYFVYEHTPTDFVRITFADSSAYVEVARKKVVQEMKYATGTIATSLWNTILDNGINPMLALELSDIYAWTVDFFGLQPADSFAVVYDEQYVDSVCVGLGKIYAAYFRHAGKAFYAIPFIQDSIESYFDLDGNSLRRAFLKAPLRFSRISSRYSHSRLHPILKIRRPHHGIDYSAPAGTPVEAIGDGKLIEASRGSGSGNIIKIRHNSTYTTCYMHLSRFAPGIASGKYVKQGDVIGYVGSTGLSTGPHLDFRFYKNGAPIDPLKVEAPPVEPVHEQNRVAFDSVKTATLNILLQNSK
jgi:murein DD-endopeptidase MepM/ murein hydrolase activator NlpD